MKPKKMQVEITAEEKVIIKILNKNQNITLEELKIQSGLSNNKLDKSIKELRKNKLLKIEKIKDFLYVKKN